MSIANIKARAVSVADKVTNSKIYKGVEKALVFGSATVATVGVSAMNVFAEGLDKITVDTTAVLGNAEPFITPAITILCAVGGIKLGWSFLRRAFH